MEQYGAEAPLPGLKVEQTLNGLPHEFLGSWARTMEPSFTFSETAWMAWNERGK